MNTLKASIKFKRPCLTAGDSWLSTRLGYACKRASTCASPRVQDARALQALRSASTTRTTARTCIHRPKLVDRICGSSCADGVEMHYEYSTGYIYPAWPRSSPLFIPAATSARARSFRAKIGPGARDERRTVKWARIRFFHAPCFLSSCLVEIRVRYSSNKRRIATGNLFHIFKDYQDGPGNL